jgi:cobalt-zinc-cadmium efflux system protein
MAHNHDHNHTPANYNRAFAIGITLNIGFVIIEASYGVIADSLALLADAGHNLSDVLGLLLAWGAAFLASKKPTRKRTYGFRRVTILASTISGFLLLVALGGIVWEAIGKFAEPTPVRGTVIIVVAAIGVVINGATALLFMSGQKHDLNIKGAYLHMATDAAVSLGVVIAGVVISITGWLWIDPSLSLAIVVIVLIGAWGLLKESLNLSIDAVPEGIDVAEIQRFLEGFRQVVKTHDLHVWGLSTTEAALTVHLVVNNDQIDNDLLHRLQDDLHDKFGIGHATIQIERESDEYNCQLDRLDCL